MAGGVLKGQCSRVNQHLALKLLWVLEQLRFLTPVVARLDALRARVLFQREGVFGESADHELGRWVAGLLSQVCQNCSWVARSASLIVRADAHTQDDAARLHLDDSEALRVHAGRTCKIAEDERLEARSLL